MSTQHKDVSSSNIHECKEASIASINTVRVSDGAGSGSWTKVSPSSITGVNNVNLMTVSTTIPDISTAGSVFVVVPVAGIISKIYTTIDNAITGTDTALTFKIAGTLVTNSAITVTQSGSSAGDVDSSTPTAARTLTAGQAIEIITDGASSTVCRATVTILINVS